MGRILGSLIVFAFIFSGCGVENAKSDLQLEQDVKNELSQILTKSEHTEGDSAGAEGDGKIGCSSILNVDTSDPDLVCLDGFNACTGTVVRCCAYRQNINGNSNGEVFNCEKHDAHGENQLQP